MKTKKFGKSIQATIEKTKKGLEKYEKEYKDGLKRIAEKYCSYPNGKEEKIIEIIEKCVKAIAVNVFNLNSSCYTERKCRAKNKKIIREAAQEITKLFLEEKALKSIIMEGE